MRAAELGAGELAVTSINREGTGKGFDLELTRRIAESVSIPVIACGGAGCAKDVRDVVLEGKADAVSVASCLHYEFIQSHQTIDDDYTAEGNTEFLRRRTSFSKITPSSLAAIKQHLSESGIACRMN